MNRRVFLLLLFAQRAQSNTGSLRMTVLETFTANLGSVAFLAHHAEAATRDQFAQWLRTHPNQMVRIRTDSGEEIPATIFRVRMCFGRALILLQRPARIREGEVMTLIPVTASRH